MVINMPTNQALSCFYWVGLWLSPYLGAFIKHLVRTDLLISSTVEIFLIMLIDCNRIYLHILVFQESNEDMEDLQYIFCLFPGYDDSRFCFVRHTFLLCQWISVSSNMYTCPQPALFLTKKLHHFPLKFTKWMMLPLWQGHKNKNNLQQPSSLVDHWCHQDQDIFWWNLSNTYIII